MGALTASLKKTVYHSAGKMVIADVTFSSSYATGGDTWTAALFGVATVEAIVPCGNAGGFQFNPDIANKKIIVLQGDNTNVASAPGIQVPNTTNLSTTTVRCIVFADEPYV